MSPLLALVLFASVSVDEPLPVGAVARFGTNHLRATDGARLSADGRTVLALHAGVLRGYAADTLARVPVPPLPAEAAAALVGNGRPAGWTPDGRFLAVAVDVRESNAGPVETTTRVTVYNLHAGTPVGRFTHPFIWGGELSADGATFVAAITDPAGPGQPTPPLKLTAWDVASGRRRTLHRIRGDGMSVVVTLSPDSRTVLVTVTPPPAAVPRPPETLCLDLSNGAERWRMPGGAVGFAFPTGRLLALVPTPDGGSRAAFHDPATGLQLPSGLPRPPAALEQGVFELTAVSPDGRRLVATYRAGPPSNDAPSPLRLRVWDLDTGTPVGDWPLTDGEFVAPLGFTADGCLVCDWGGQVRRFDLSTGRPVGPDPGDGHRTSVVRLAYAPNGRSLVSHGFGEVRAWDVTAVAQRANWPRTGFAPDGVLSADGRTVWSLAKPGQVVARDAATGKPVGGFEVPLEPRTDALPGPIPVALPAAPAAPAPAVADPIEEALEELGGTAAVRVFVAAQYAAALPVWLSRPFIVETAPAPQPAPIPLPPPPLPMCCDSTGRPFGQLAVRPDRSAVVHFDPGACVFTGHEPASGQVLWRAKVQGEELQRAARDTGTLSPDGRFLACGLGSVDTHTGRLRFAWSKSEKLPVVNPVQVSPDGRLAAAFLALPDHPRTPDWGPPLFLEVWDTATGMRVYNGASRCASPEPVPFAFTPTGDRFVVAKPDGLCVWSIPAGCGTASDRHAFKAGGGITALAVSPDGTTLAVGNRDGTVLLWPLPPAPAAEPVADAWERLAQPNGFAAAWTLAARPDESARRIETLLKPTPAPTAARIRELVQALDAPRYADRESASRALRAIGPVAEGELRQAALAESPELRTRAGLVLASFDQPTPRTGDGLRAVRAVAVLEQIGTPAARKLLEAIAAGGHSPVTVAAKDAVARLAGRDTTDRP